MVGCDAQRDVTHRYLRISNLRRRVSDVAETFRASEYWVRSVAMRSPCFEVKGGHMVGCDAYGVTTFKDPRCLSLRR